MAAVAAKPPSNLPSFRYVGPRLHRGASTVLLGDAIHTVKPYFGLGANSALEDVIVLCVGAHFDLAVGEVCLKAAAAFFAQPRLCGPLT